MNVGQVVENIEVTGLDRRDESAGVVVGGDHNVRSLTGTNSIESYAVQDSKRDRLTALSILHWTEC